MKTTFTVYCSTLMKTRLIMLPFNESNYTAPFNENNTYCILLPFNENNLYSSPLMKAIILLHFNENKTYTAPL